MVNKKQKPTGWITCKNCRGTTYVFEPIDQAKATAMGNTATATMTKRRCLQCRDGFIKL